MDSNQKKINHLKFLPQLIFIVFLALIVWSVYMLNEGGIDPNTPCEAILKIEITGQSGYTIDNKKLNSTDFDQQLFEKVNELKNNGIPNENVLCAISAKGDVLVGEVSDIQRQLRDLGVRKISYRRY